MKNILNYTAIIITTFLLIGFSNNKIKANETIHRSGDFLNYALPATAYGLTFFYLDGEGSLEYSESLALTLGLTYALKYGINEQRPDGGNYSFPSGHTSASFSAAEFMWERYGWKYGLPAYVLATFVGYSRVEVHEHYVHDVIVGAAIGILSSHIFTKPFNGWQVSVEGDTKNIGLQFSRNF